MSWIMDEYQEEFYIISYSLLEIIRLATKKARAQSLRRPIRRRGVQASATEAYFC